jgi:hypothetical protein
MVDSGTGGGLASLVEDSAAAKVGSTLFRGSVTIFHVKNPYQSICLIMLMAMLVIVHLLLVFAMYDQVVNKSSVRMSIVGRR